jgi:hypothetical protein
MQLARAHCQASQRSFVTTDDALVAIMLMEESLVRFVVVVCWWTHTHHTSMPTNDGIDGTARIQRAGVCSARDKHRR